MKNKLFILSILTCIFSLHHLQAMETGSSSQTQEQQLDKQLLLNKQLLKAVSDLKPVETIKELIQQGADVNTCDNYKDCALHIAAHTWNRRVDQFEQDNTWKLETIKLLLYSGANPNMVNTFQETPLILLSNITGDNDLAQLLLEYGADPNIAKDNGVTPLRWAAVDYAGDIVRTLMTYGADPHIASMNGNNALSRDVDQRLINIINSRLLFITANNKAEIIVSDNSTPRKQFYFSILVCTVDIPHLKKLFKLLQTQNNLQLFSSLTTTQEIVTDEHDFKRAICQQAVKKPGIIMKYIQQGFYDKKVIGEYYTDPQQQQVQPVICARVLNALYEMEKYSQSLSQKLRTGTFADVTFTTNRE